jgi:3'-5' exoribonuclease
MKAVYVSDLAVEQSITSFFLVAAKEARTGPSGRAYLRLELADRTGSIDARIWEGSEAAGAKFDAEDFVKVQGRVESYRGKNQLIIERIRPAEENEIDPADFFPHTTEDVEQLYARLREVVAGIQNPWLRRLLESVVDDADIAPKLKRAPAAKSMHHAYLGGLLEHIVNLCELCRAMAPRYPQTDVDLLLAGAVLHDIGKLDELRYDRAFAYTSEGWLLGHILIAYEMVTKKIDAIEGFPRELKTLVQHLVISHHGRYEFGSPRLPMFREAVLLHYLDDLDSKMSAVRAALESEKGEGEWSAWNAALERRLLRTDLYRREEAPGSAAPEQLRTDSPLPDD